MARTRHVFVVGAGLSSSFGLPNTYELLPQLLTFVKNDGASRWKARDINGALGNAYKFFYPDARKQSQEYRPDVVDFFSTLDAYISLSKHFPERGLKNPEDLYTTLKLAISHLLHAKTQSIQDSKLIESEFMKRMVRPGNIIITTNWDLLIESYASKMGVKIRRSSLDDRFSTECVTLLKLHGSIDWCQSLARKAGKPDELYRPLRALEPAKRATKFKLPVANSEELIRVEAKSYSSAWQSISSGMKEPWIVTMATGKSDVLGPLTGVWRDAYRGLGMASEIDIVGYSLPRDDLEVRTLIRSGVQHGNVTRRMIRVKNPDPHVHSRFREFVDREIESDYVPL